MITRSRSNSLGNNCNATSDACTPVRGKNTHSRRHSKINSRGKNEIEKIKSQENENPLHRNSHRMPKYKGSYNESEKSSCLGKRNSVLKTEIKKQCDGDNGNESEGSYEVETVVNGSPSRVKLKRAVVLLTDCTRVTPSKTNYKNEGSENHKLNCDSFKTHSNVDNGNTSDIEVSSECSESEDELVEKKSLRCRKCFILLKNLLSHANDHGLERKEVLMNYISPKCKALLSVGRKNGGVYSLVYGSDNEETQRLTDLAEGCNFSQILKKFRRHSNDADMNKRDSTSLVENNANGECSPEHLKKDDSKDINSNTRDRTVSESCDVSTICPTEHKLKSVDNFNEREESEGKSNEEIIIETDNSNQEPLEPSSDEEEGTINSKTDSDESTTNGRSKLDSVCELSEDESTIEYLEPDTLGNDVVVAEEESNSSESEEVSDKEKLCTVQKNKTNVDLYDLSTDDFQLELIQKELEKRGMINIPSKEAKESESRKEETRKLPISSSTPPKKMKHSKKNKPKDEQTDSSKLTSEDYIPLNVSGPTKFAVAPLNKLKPPQTHDCRNFKERMLFGNRINRVSSGELRTLKLKQKAGKFSRPSK